MANILQLVPRRAQVTINDASFNQMHPFVQFKLNGNKQKTQTHKNGNRNPFWQGEEIIFEGVNHHDELIVQLFDENTYDSGEAVGFAEVPLNQFVTIGQTAEITVPLNNQGDDAGTITLVIRLAPPPTKGTISIRPLRAQITIPDASFNQMHPFVQVKVNGNKKKSNVCQNGNRNPLWNDEITFDVDINDEIIIQVFDQNTYDSGEAIGFAETTVKQLTRYPRVFQTDIPLENCGDEAGHITIQAQLHGEGGDIKTFGQQSFGGFGDQAGFGGQGGFAPVGGFGDQGGFGQPQGGFGQPQGGFGGQGGFGDQGGFGQPQGGFGQPQGGFGQPQGGFGGFQ